MWVLIVVGIYVLVVVVFSARAIRNDYRAAAASKKQARRQPELVPSRLYPFEKREP